MRLLYLCSDPGIPPDGHKGAAVHFRELARALTGAGAELAVHMARPGSAAGFPAASLRIVEPPRQGGVPGELRLIAHGAAMAEALAEAGPADGIYERLSLFGAAGLAHARAADLPLVVEVNAPLWEEAARYRSLHLRETARALAMDVLRGADRVLVVSPALAETVLALGVPAEKLQVFGNGVRASSFENAKPAPRPAPLRDKPTILFLGSLKPWHGVDFLLRAFEYCCERRDLGLWVVGDGPEAGKVQEAARRWPEAVVHRGAVAHDEVPGILLAADAVVAPYPADAPDYFCPLKVVEAIAARRPLLATATRCVVDTAGKDLPGLFAAGDVEDFARALDRVLADPEAARPPDRLAELSWEGKARELLGWFAGRSAAPTAGRQR